MTMFCRKITCFGRHKRSWRCSEVELNSLELWSLAWQTSRLYLHRLLLMWRSGLVVLPPQTQLEIVPMSPLKIPTSVRHRNVQTQCWTVVIGLADISPVANDSYKCQRVCGLQKRCLSCRLSCIYKESDRDNVTERWVQLPQIACWSAF